MRWKSSLSLSLSSRQRQQPSLMRAIALLTCLSISALLLYYSQLLRNQFSTVILSHKHRKFKPKNAHEILARCKALKVHAEPPEGFSERARSDRFEDGTAPVLIKNARLWTGGKNGTEVIEGDMLLDKGIIKSIGHLHVASVALAAYGSSLRVVDTNGSWITPGLVDIHSHLGLAPSPILEGTSGESTNGNTAPWLRALDTLNTHDESYPLSIAGGVSTALVLPGSLEAIGGQGYAIKLRETSERSPSSMLLEPPYNINASFPNPNLPRRWRHMKHACGENPGKHHKNSRMDTIWALREAYTQAAKAKEAQDKFCSHVLAKRWADVAGTNYPNALQWEALVDVLRGRVKLHIHCYEAVDLDALVRLSNEFKFPIAAFHHASEAYLVPNLLNKTHGESGSQSDHLPCSPSFNSSGKPPAVALFATNTRYKREAYRGSEFAPKLLAQKGITVLMKSDHPTMDSRHLIYEAQQAFYYGLPANLALASVTSNPAKAMGLSHRIGFLREGYDADVVVWDSHPLALGATPTQVFIDGIPQFSRPVVVKKPENYQKLPRVPNWGGEAQRVVEWDGLPPLEVVEPENQRHAKERTTVFINVGSVMRRSTTGNAVVTTLGASNVQGSSYGMVVVEKGQITCQGTELECGLSELQRNSPDAIQFVDLEGGSVTPGLVSFGSPLGLETITNEPSTNDGSIADPLTEPVADLLGGDTNIVRASDGIKFATRDALLAYRFGVTSAITAPRSSGFYGGLGVHFSTGASGRMQKGAVKREITALHLAVKHFGPNAPSVSTQIATLRRLLQGKIDGALGHYFEKIREGRMPLVIEAHNADIIATLIILKKETEADTRKTLKLTITGASEAHLLAKEIAEAGVGIILVPSRGIPVPFEWESRRLLPGPPLTPRSSIDTLLDHGVVLGIGCQDKWQARNLAFDVAWAAIQSEGKISKETAIAIGSTNLEALLGADRDPHFGDLVATKGGDLLDVHSKVVAVISPETQSVHLVDSS